MCVHVKCFIGVKKGEKEKVTPFMSLRSKGGEVLRALPPTNVAWLRVPASTLYVWVCCLLTCVSLACEQQTHFRSSLLSTPNILATGNKRVEKIRYTE